MKITEKILNQAFSSYQSNLLTINSLNHEIDTLSQPFLEQIAKINDKRDQLTNPLLAKLEALQLDQEVQRSLLLQGVPENTTIGRIHHKTNTRKSISYQSYASWLKDKFIPKTKLDLAEQGIDQFTKISTTHQLEILE